MPWVLRYVLDCLKLGFTQWRIHQAIVGVIVVIVGFAFKNWFSSHQFIIPLYLVLWLAIYTFVFVPAHLWHNIQKIDKKDLEHLLYGLFIGNTFLYSADITQLCARYEGKSDIERLKNNLTKISVRAPRKSWASIKLQFMNGHENISSKCYFYFLDHNNKLTLIDDIYKNQQIYLDDNSCFFLKLDYDEKYIMHEQASLWITVDSWTK